MIIIGKFKDLTGMVFGRLKVLKRDYEKADKIYWICECQCKKHTIKSVLGKSLTKKNGTKSCGCISGKTMKDLSGIIFGKLLVLKIDNDKKSKYTHWLCECQCENKTIISVAVSNLTKKNGTQSCGCYQIEQSQKQMEDLTDRMFGKLKALKRDYSKNNATYWICECQCINKTIKSIAAGDLKRSNTMSCGCDTKEMISIANKKYNTYNLTGEYGIGYTSKGEKFYFDLEDYDKIKNYCWSKSTNKYIECYNLKNSILKMHRLILMLDDNDFQIDHINHNRMDNRKENLRIVTNSQNQMNTILRKDNTSGVKGVMWHKRDQIWEAWISINKNNIYLGRYINKDDAIKVRKEAEEIYHGEYTYDNSIKQSKYNNIQE